MPTRKLSDVYFNRSYQTVADTPTATMQVCYAVFCRKDVRMCGVGDVLRLIDRTCAGPIIVRGRADGREVAGNEIALLIEGPFGQLVPLETEYLGMLSLSRAAHNMAQIVEAARQTQVVDFGARHWPPEINHRLAVAAAIGGAAGTSTQAGCEAVHARFGAGNDLIHIGDEPPREFKAYGTIPHALNAVYDGSSIESAVEYHERHPNTPLTVLIDFEGKERDVTAEAVKRFGRELYAVRLDTPGNRVHQGGHDQPTRAMEMRILSQATDRAAAMKALKRYGFGPGVTIEAAYAIRDLLDSLNAQRTRIVVSSGFDLDKVRAFKTCNAPIDSIGTGSWVEFVQFTSDIIRVRENGQWTPRAKVGRLEELTEPEEMPVLLQK